MRRSAAIIVALALVFGYVLLANAEENSDLEATVRAAILSDPRTAQMSEAEIDAMVAALAAEAETQGVTSEDIIWRPQEQAADAGEGAPSCNFLCALSQAFGFDGSDLTIPIALAVASGVLLFLIGMLLHRLGRHPVIGRLRGDA